MKPSTPTDLELDFRERQGFQIGRAAALADWSLKRDDRAFARLCKRLYQRDRFTKAPEHVRAIGRASARRRRLADGDRKRGVARARYRRTAAKRRAWTAAWRAAHRVTIDRTCERCSAAFTTCRSYQRFCSLACRNAHRNALRAPAGPRTRNPLLTDMVLEALRAAPGVALNEVAQRVPASSYGSVAAKLGRMMKAGQVVRVDGRYSLPEAA